MKTSNMFHKERPIPIRTILSQRVEAAFRQLLESKHLYQSVPVDFSNTGVNEIEAAEGNAKVAFLEEWLSLVRRNWLAYDQKGFPDTGSFFLGKNIMFCPPDVKLYCTQKCERVEAFNLSGVDNFLARGGTTNVDLHNPSGTIVQVFVLSYVCQSCKSIPEVFLVRREGPKITLSGRSPIEHIEVPKSIPKVVGRFYSGAIVAHQSGQTLAGNFLLRTLLEQFANTKATDPESADEAIDQYMNTLTENFKASFPSFRELYSTLSEDIHSAKGSPEVFDDSIRKIIKHFDARKLFELQ